MEEYTIFGYDAQGYLHRAFAVDFGTQEDMIRKLNMARKMAKDNGFVRLVLDIALNPK